MDWFNSVPISTLNKNLDGLWAREQTISDNIANYETPNYKSKYVTFEEDLLAELEKSGSSKEHRLKDISSVNITEHTSDAQALRADGNNVDLEAENIEMARTQLNYVYSIQNIDEYFSRLRTAIKG